MFKKTTFLFCVLTFSNLSIADEVSSDANVLLSKVRNNLSALKAEFIQYEWLESNQKTDINSGTVWMQAPAQFRWQYIEPIEQLIVADGKQVWVYDEDLEQVTVKAQDNSLNPIYVIINDELSKQHYDIKHEVNSQGLDWLSLTPKLHSEEVKSVWLAIKGDVITQIKVFNHFDQTMVFEFMQVQRNPEVSDDLFTFVPPEGVDVIQAIGE